MVCGMLMLNAHKSITQKTAHECSGEDSWNERPHLKVADDSVGDDVCEADRLDQDHEARSLARSLQAGAPFLVPFNHPSLKPSFHT